jgi:lysophospholipase L1-like esterase
MKPDAPLRAPIAAVNRALDARFAGVATVTVMDTGPKFLATDGTLPTSMMPDGTHPSEAGYAIRADALIAAGMHR